MNEQWVRIGAVADIPRRGARCVATPMGELAVFRTADDAVFAIENRCPHKGGPLSEGIVHGAAVTCPLHNIVFALDTGIAMGADEGRVRTFRTRIAQGELFIHADDIAVPTPMGRAA